ncbi:TOMM system kinase/cyclase fusion protein [Sorangium cellulosum]|uniref:TOMM system kinase/cyclase fusion protein n=1 Tax=Sorangium cellulosum TaxID=56 RepID=UPI003D9A1BFE
MAILGRDLAERGPGSFGRYELLEKVGEGGFGDVYKARQLTTGQLVAIKVLRVPEDRSGEQRERLLARFEREARLCAQLQHPNIVRLMDSGQAEGGSVYSVFEFIPGRTLAAVLAAEQRLRPVEARHLMLQVLDALACAHAQGVIHRDLKPENIMVVPTGARRNAVVLDFGISALTDEARREEVRITRTNEWLGTPVYAAPEQLRGERPLSRSDLYAWGLIFLECLTGQRPIRGASLVDVMSKQLSPEPIPIPWKLVAHPLGRLLRRATEKSPEARDVTAERLLQELDACNVSDLDLDARLGSVPSNPSNEVTVTMMMGRDTHHQPEASHRADVLPAAARPSDGERRQVTVVCCTFSVVWDAPGGADLDDLDDLLGAEHDACAAIAEREGGRVGGALNDTILFFFGHAAAREDDPQRAARASLAMAAGAGGRRATNTKECGARVEIRIGVHTGMVVARDLGGPEGSWPGRLGGATPQIATRLSALAPPGEILVSGDAHRLLRDDFQLEGRGIPPGLGVPTDVYRLRQGVAAQDARDTPLVGRQRDLDALLERWTRVRGGSGHAVLITGEPGIGKSRLTRALRERIGADPHTALEGRCAADATNSPLYPVITMLDRLLDPAHERSAEAKAEQLEALLSRHGFDLAEVVPLLATFLSLPLPASYTPLTLPPQKQRELTYNAVLSLIFEMSEHAPVLVVIEDLHWADPSTVELCAALVTEAPSGRVFAVFTGRPEFSPTWSPSAAFVVQLGPLDRSDVARMAAVVSGGRALPPEVAERIAARTDGVPLFVEELVQMMLESGDLSEHNGRLALTGVLDDLRIPNTLRGSLMARLDRLGRAKATSQVAAVIGREFSFDLLRAVHPLDEGALRDDLDRLVASDLVHRKRRLRNPAYVFKHALVQDTAYDAIPKGRRRAIHERIARALERDFPGVAEEQPELLARHFDQAGLDDQATAYLLRAGQRAMQRSAFSEAAALLKQGIETVARSSEATWAVRRELELRAVLAGTIMNLTAWTAPEAELNLVRARDLCVQLGDPPELLTMTWALWQFHLMRSNRDAAEGCARELLAIAERRAEPRDLIQAFVAHGFNAYYSQCYDDAREWFLRVVSLYEPERQHADLVRAFGEDGGVHAHAHLPLVDVHLGNIGDALCTVKRTRALTEQLRDPHSRVIAAVCAMCTYQLLGQHTCMAAEAETALEISNKHGFSMWETFARIGDGLARVLRGDAVAGIAQMRAGFSFFDLMGQWTARTLYANFMLEALFVAGHHAEVAQMADETIEASAGKMDQGQIPSLLCVKARSLELIGESDRAASVRRSALAVAKGRGDHYASLRISLDIARSLLRSEQREEARGFLMDALSNIRDGEGWPEYEDAIQLIATLSRPRHGVPVDDC